MYFTAHKYTQKERERERCNRFYVYYYSSNFLFLYYFELKIIQQVCVAIITKSLIADDILCFISKLCLQRNSIFCYRKQSSNTNRKLRKVQLHILKHDKRDIKKNFPWMRSEHYPYSKIFVISVVVQENRAFSSTKNFCKITS